MSYLVRPSVMPQYCPLFQLLPSWVQPRKGPTQYQYDPERLPEKAVQKSTHKNVPDFVVIGGIWCVSAAFKSLVEELEPGRHKFYPLPMFRRDGTPIPVPHFIFDSANAVDAIVPELSNVRVGDAGAMLFSFGSDLAIDMSKVSGLHVWRGRTTALSSTFFSNDLKEAVERAKLKKLNFEETRVKN